PHFLVIIAKSLIAIIHVHKLHVHPLVRYSLLLLRYTVTTASQATSRSTYPRDLSSKPSNTTSHTPRSPPETPKTLTQPPNTPAPYSPPQATTSPKFSRSLSKQ
ncbi:hypothetical protein BC835DRAFT_160898, partial [Cytidiella melzeri]